MADRSNSRERGTHPLRVLHIIESLGPAGAEQALVNLLPALRSCGIESEVAALWPPYDLARTLRLKGIPVHELNIPSPWSVWSGIRKLLDLRNNNNFDLFHAHLPMAVFYAAIVRGTKPVVATFHGLSFEFYPATTLAKKIRRRGEQWWTSHRVNAFTAVSSAVAKHYRQRLNIPLEQIQIIPNGFPTADLSPDSQLDSAAVRSHYGVGVTDFLILHVGRLIPQKGHIYLVKALARLKQQGINFQALFFGHGHLRAAIESSIADHALQGSVRLHAPVSHSELKQVLQAADLFVFPSISEGFGMAAGEAMCLGVPVIASDIPGIASLIESGVSGLLIPPADAESLANAIKRAMSDEKFRAQVASGGIQRMRLKFTCDVIAARMAAVYRTTLNNLGREG